MKKLLFALLTVGLFNACTDNLADLNTDPKRPSEVPSGSLVANATVELFDLMSSCNVNDNNFRLWAQQWAQTTYPDESNYQLVERDVNGRTWDKMYATVIRDLKEAKTFIEADQFLTDTEKAAQLAITDVLEAVAYTHLVDIFGNVPYTEALSGDVTPAYDDAATIYDAMITKLDAATKNLSGDSGMGASDLIYGGNADAWATFANSYMLRLAIRLADGNDARAKTMAETAISNGVFASNTDNFTITYETATPNTNPVWESLVQSGRSDFVAANTMVDHMNRLEDPRRGFYYKDQQDIVIDTTTGETITVWQGGTYGDANNYANNSKPGTILEDPTHPGTIMGYTEVLFLLADAAERDYSTGGSAEDFYHAGITNSITEWGGGQGMVDDYLANPDVAYSTASGNWKEKIAMQKWLALYDQGFEAWTTYRIYDAPAMNIAKGAGTLPPFRFTYPVDEFSLNGANVQAAGDAIGGDDLMTKVFWDVN